MGETSCLLSKITSLLEPIFLLLICLGGPSGIAKAGPGRAHARPKFVLLMCAQALVLLAQWLSIQQVPGQYQ